MTTLENPPGGGRYARNSDGSLTRLPPRGEIPPPQPEPDTEEE